LLIVNTNFFVTIGYLKRKFMIMIYNNKKSLVKLFINNNNDNTNNKRTLILNISFYLF